MWKLIFLLLLVASSLLITEAKKSKANNGGGKKAKGNHGGGANGGGANGKSCSVSDDNRFDCLPQVNLTAVNQGAAQATCEARGCCWGPLSDQKISGPFNARYKETNYPIFIGAPPCYLPQKYPSLYQFQNQVSTSGLQTGQTVSALLNRKQNSPFPSNVNNVKIELIPQTKNSLRIKISDADNNKRYEVPLPVLSPPSDQVSNPNYDVQFGNNFGFKVSRKDTGETIFDATVGEFMFADQFIQLSAILASKQLFGLSQSHDTFQRSLDWQLCPLFASGLFPDYGSHPFYLALEKSGKSHGVFLFNSNAMDVILQPAPAITYRVIGGILDFYIFLGPTPEEVTQQYHQLIGLPTMAPYWSMGFHLCRYDYGSLSATEAVWERNVAAGIPYDVQWNDIDYMNTGYEIFTYNQVTYNGLPQFIDTLHSKNMRYVCITDAGIAATKGYTPYDNGVTDDIFIKNSTGGYATGQVWPNISVFTDFTNNKSYTYWSNQFNQFHQKMAFDGSWIDMNEMTTFSSGSIYNQCPNTTWDNPPYVPHVYTGKLYGWSICMSSVQEDGLHYDLHNLYGFTMAMHTHQALESSLGLRPFVLSRSTFPGHGKYAFHWTGDVYSSWDDFRQVIPSILNMNLFGIPMVGSDICGFRENTTFDLCQRWTQLGAFQPFARNHNDKGMIDQDPAAMGPEMVTTFKNAFFLRYTLLPFMYTQFYRVHTQGGTVIRPLFFEFPNDQTTYNIQNQFLWGSELMVVPILEPNSTSIDPYFPSGVWYFWPNLRAPIVSKGMSLSIEFDTKTETSVFIRGGSIIPTQAANTTTDESRKNPFGLIVALDDNQFASGDLFWDDGTAINSVEKSLYSYITFNASQNRLWSDVVNNFQVPKTNFMLYNITILGIYKIPSNVYVQNISQVFFYNPDAQCLQLTNLSIPLSESMAINWAF